MRLPFIQIDNAIPCLPELEFKEPVSWTMNEGEHWAFVGPNGAGKTLLADILCGKIALKQGKISYHFAENSTIQLSEAIQTISFRDVYSLADYKNMYYQQRFNATENEESPLVDDLLNRCDRDNLNTMLEIFNLKHLLGKRIIFFSSGELRKFLIVRTLQKNPRLLILDNPFIGLDASSREYLKEALSQMIQLNSLQIILILSSPDDIPEMITHILPISGKKLKNETSRIDFLENIFLQKELFPVNWEEEINLPINNSLSNFSENIVEMKNIHIRYGKKDILKDINWKIEKGEKWALLGPNGAGKSTLLSLIYADNPQAYSNNITLFGKERGSGESIWEIKSRIGYVSPEMHLFYLKNVPAIDIVGSGFFDTIGLYRKCNAEQLAICEEWMELFNIKHLKNTSFLKLSSGEQRLTLLARAFVKNPSLLILDEPLHGLDKSNKVHVRRIIEKFCNKDDKTLIYVTHYRNEIPNCVNKYFELQKN